MIGIYSARYRCEIMATDKIKVAVRVRPFNRRELELGTQCVVEMSGQQTILQHPTTMDKIERQAREHSAKNVDGGAVIQGFW